MIAPGKEWNMKKNIPTADALLVAIRAKCMDCSGNQRREVEQCKLKECTLYPYRCIKALGGEHECQAEIKGQIDLFDVLIPNKEEQAI